ncbi:YicC/YloC family endoribonuclease [Thermodesulfobacterium hydrogeniphilum]|uniref:YicC/YloC family endoribonuclease n=1 Tax=Thermodesulfobacterium hydrogeniphilum TaxID=161156 RepID=UPI0006916C87|nr:YicC/YloC family endoribonuclease [Thermodesulfobacterium hydrogeniphilum]
MESMTGFGKGVSQAENYIISVYIKSVNSRYLDISLRLPRRYTYLEERIRKLISEYFNRGKIELQIRYTGAGLVAKEILLDLELARRLKAALTCLKYELGFEEPLSFSDFLRFRDYIILEDKEEDLEKLWEEIYPALKQALEELKTFRQKEGESLKEFLKAHLIELKEKVSEIEKLKEEIIEKNKEKLKKRLDKLFQEFDLKSIDENRFYQEVVHLLDKIDFTEELDRLKIHINHFELTMEEEKCGKKLDFLCQEMFREINTLSNKAQSPEISLIAVKVKDLIEKLREQIQNIA